jgi:hypothetical protein
MRQIFSNTDCITGFTQTVRNEEYFKFMRAFEVSWNVEENYFNYISILKMI